MLMTRSGPECLVETRRTRTGDVGRACLRLCVEESRSWPSRTRRGKHSNREGKRKGKESAQRSPLRFYESRTGPEKKPEPRGPRRRDPNGPADAAQFAATATPGKRR